MTSPVGTRRNRRTARFVVGDLAVFGVSTVLAVLIRYGAAGPGTVWSAVPFWLAIALPVKVISNAVNRAYSRTWEFTADRDTLALLAATVGSAVAWGLVANALHAVWHHPGPTNAVLALDA